MRSLILLVCILFSSVAYSEDIRLMEVYGATWCQPCQKLKSDLKNNEKLKIFVEKNFWKVNNIDVSNVPFSKYGLAKIPTIRIWNWNKEEKKWVLKKTIIGYTSPESFILNLEEKKYGELGNYRSGDAK